MEIVGTYACDKANTQTNDDDGDDDGDNDDDDDDVHYHCPTLTYHLCPVGDGVAQSVVRRTQDSMDQ